METKSERVEWLARDRMTHGKALVHHIFWSMIYKLTMIFIFFENTLENCCDSAGTL